MPTFRTVTRVDRWRIHIVSKIYGVLPSEVATLSLAEFHFCEVVSTLGIRVENELERQVPKGQQRRELADMLREPGPDGKPVDVATLNTVETEYYEKLVKQGGGKVVLG